VNTKKLEALGIRCPKVIGTYEIRNPNPDIVHYVGLEGQSLRQRAKTEPINEETKKIIQQFVADLHKKGVFFRSLHSGNIIVQDEKLGLIDVSDLKLKLAPLGDWERRRNYKHINTDPLLQEILKR